MMTKTERNRRIFELHLAGVTYTEITQHVDLSSQQIGVICRELRYQAQYKTGEPT